MGEFDAHAGINGDWMPPSPSPSPRSFFSAILGYDTGSASVSELPLTDEDNNNTTGFTFPEPDKQFGSENGQPTKASSRSGLVERMAARAGYNAPRLNTTDIIRPSVAESSYLTIPPGLSPTSLLDSPVFLSNSLVQPSPTTGKFPFAPNGNGNSRSSSMMFSKDNLFEDLNTSSFAFKPVPESSGAPLKVNPPFISWQSFSSIEASGQSENRFPPQSIETDKVNDFQNGNSDLSDVNKTELNNFTSQTRPFGANNGNVEENHNEDADRLMNVDNANSGPSEDGYNWRKYGQKQVKGSEYPRSYYKCTHPNCPVKKKVERSQEGHITEIIYKGAHNHPKPPLNRRIGSSSGGDWMHDGNFEVASSTMGGHGPSGSQFESSDAVTFSNEEEEDDDRATHGSVSLGNNDDDESESKRRKVEDYAADISASSRAMREPRVVVQTTSEVDILDDGYRWRKYGQKVVKGNPNPRSYYKCTSTGCTVRKHVERASQDLKSVITTYEGKHNHDVPAARNNNNNNHQSQIQIQNRMHEYGYGMEAKMSILQHQSQYMLPKGEPVSDHPSLYHHQIMNSFSHI